MGPATGKIIGKAGLGHTAEEAQTILASSMKPVYESRKFTIGNGTSSYDFKTQQSAFGAALPRAHAVLIRSDANITVRFNDDSNDDIEVDADTPFPYSALEMTNIFFDNASGGDAIIRVLLG